MREERPLPGGNAGGAVRVGDTVRRTPGSWTPAVHALLAHLHDVGFDRAPRPLGFDQRGREILTYLPGETVGDRKPWPSWVHSDTALIQVATWLRDYHQAVAGFAPTTDAVWRMGEVWAPGQIICHNDVAPYNAAWNADGLVGFFDWDFAGPGDPDWDLAFTACAWVPLHARHVATGEGFTRFAERRHRLDLFLDAYGWRGDPAALLKVVRRRVQANIDGVNQLAAAGDPLFVKLRDEGAVADMQTALEELDSAL